MITYWALRKLDKFGVKKKLKKIEQRFNSGEKVEIEEFIKLSVYYQDIEKDFDKSALYALKAFEMDPNNLNLRNHLFELYFLKKDYYKAIEILELIKSDGRDDLSVVNYNLGYMYFLMGDREKAEVYRNEAILIDPNLKENIYKPQ